MGEAEKKDGASGPITAVLVSREVTRDQDGRWIKGTGSPNPGGRPAELAALRRRARERDMDYLDVLDSIARDLPIELPAKAPLGARVVGPSHKERALAAVACLEIGYGQLRSIKDTGEDGDRPPFDMSKLTYEEVMSLRALVAKARGDGGP